jgi:hypothetical protein
MLTFFWGWALLLHLGIHGDHPDDCNSFCNYS